MAVYSSSHFLLHPSVGLAPVLPLAMTLSVWFTGLVLDNTEISPRQFTFILALGTLWPIIPWMWLNHNDPLRETAVASETTD